MFCALLAISFPAAAQTTGTIAGRIVDAGTEGDVAGALVSASGPTLQGEQAVQTGERGDFALTQLPPGVYTLNVQREGYQAFTQENVTVRLDRTVVLRLSILPDTMTAAPVALFTPRPLVSVPTTQTGGTVTREQMELVPYGRDTRTFDQAALSVPGVVPDPFGLQIAGSQSLESRVLIDGVDTTDPGSSRSGTRLLQNFVEQISVDTGGYQAEYGRSMGGRVAAVTRSGSNEFHGSAFLDVVPLEASRKDPGGFGATVHGKDSLRYDVDGGFELGGPILRDRLWFYAGFAPQIASRNVDRVVQTGGTGVASSRYTATQTEFQYVGKLDYRVADDHHLALSVFGNPGSTSGVMVGPGGLDAALNGNESSFLGRGTMGATDLSLRYFGKVLDRRLQIDAAITWHRSGFSVSPASAGGVDAQQVRDTPSVTYLSTLNLLDPRIVDATTPMAQTALAACTPTASKPVPCPVTLYATGGLTPQDVTSSRLAASLALSHSGEWVGHHQFKYGVEVAREGHDVTRTYAGGMLASVLPGGQLAVTAFAQRDPANPSVPARDAQGNLLGTTVETETHQWSLAAFAQDSWNLVDQLWLNAGLRVEQQRMFGSAGSQIDAVGGGTLQAFQLTNLMPRVGLSYDFTGAGLSRAYAFYGRFYESVPLDLADRVLSGRTSVQYVADATKCAPSGTFTSVDPRKCPAASPYAFAGGVSSGVLIDPDLRGSANDQYSAGVQYQLFGDVVVGIDYTHKSLGRAIEDMSINGAAGGAMMVTNPGTNGTAGAVIGTVVVPPASRSYDGVTLALTKRFSQGYLLQASYAVSSWRGNYAGLFRPENLQADPNLTSEYDRVSTFANKSGPLPGDTPQVFKLDGAYVYEYTPKTTFTFGAAFRAIQGGALSYLARDPAAPQAGATESFVLPRGDAGRLPWTTTLDLRAGFNYALTASYSATVTLDLLNVFNRQSASAEDQRYSLDASGVAPQPPGTSLSGLRNGAGQPVTVNPAFKSAVAYSPPFAMRLGLRLSF